MGSRWTILIKLKIWTNRPHETDAKVSKWFHDNSYIYKYIERDTVFIHIYIYIYTHILVYTYKHICTHQYAHRCLYVDMCIYIYIYIYVYICICIISICICFYVYVRGVTRDYVHVPLFWPISNFRHSASKNNKIII